MFLSKRIAKLHKMVSSQPQEDLHRSKIIKDNKKSLRCKFTDIPPPAKYVHTTPVYSIYGDIPFMAYKGKLVTEISLYNQLKNYKDISINKVDEQSIITIKPILRTDKEFHHWNEVVDTLSKSNDAIMDEWASLIKTYSHTYSKVMQRQSRKKMKSEPRKKFFYQVTDETNSQSKNLFEKYPCLKLKFRIKNHQNILKEILVNETLIKEIGYSIETFITVILQEGFPQIMPYDNPLASVAMKALIKNYFTISDRGYEVEELACPLLMKNNFAKNMTFKTYFFMNYEDSVFGMDIIIALTSVGEPYLLPKSTVDQELNEDFIQSMASQEGESDYFITNFYDQAIKKKYTDLYKTCMLKEIKENNVDYDSTDNGTVHSE